VSNDDDTVGPWALRDPRRPHPALAVIDDDSAAVLDQATVALTLLRSPMQLGDHLAELHALSSLREQIDDWLPRVVAAARDQAHSWNDIADQLGMTPGAARRRYPPHRTTTTTTTR